MIKTFTIRNLKLYRRDKGALLFSILAVFIIIGLYVFFLGDIYKSDLKEFERAGEMLDNWVMAGVLAVTSVTTTMGMLGTLVRDKEEGILKDFYCAPVKQHAIIGGYWLSTYIVGVCMSILAFVLAEVYVVAAGGKILEGKYILLVMGMILFTSFVNTSMMLLLVSFFKTINAFTTASTILGTLIGFITGIYLPIGMYPNAVQMVIKCFPASHAAVLFRKLMMAEVMEDAFYGVPAEVVLDVKKHLGIVYVWEDLVVETRTSIFFMLAASIIFYGIALYNLTRKSK